MKSQWKDADVYGRVKATHGFTAVQAYFHLTGRELVIEHSFSDGWFCHDSEHEKCSITEDTMREMGQLMEQWYKEAEFEERSIPRSVAFEYFENCGRKDKEGILKVMRQNPVPTFKMTIPDGTVFWDIRYRNHCVDRRELLDTYCLQKLHWGILIRFPAANVPGSTAVGRSIGPFIDKPRTFSVVESHEKFGFSFAVENVSQLNRKIFEKSGIIELLWVCEGLHEKRFGQVADFLCNKNPETGKLLKRVVCIAGPSSSGKTTSAKRLATHLLINGHGSVYIGMDDFYKSPEEVPIDPQLGQRNYDILSSLHVDMIVDRVKRLIAGDGVPSRKYSFRTHCGEDDYSSMLKAGPEDLIVIEGIHGLNPEFTNALGGSTNVHKLYVSAMTQLNIDNQHHVSTADNRLLRRMIRDFRTRGYAAEDTLRRWATVRRNEDLSLFPYQEEADMFINTALAYEIAVLSSYCKPLLAEIKTDDPQMEAEVARLLQFCDLFYPMAIAEHLIPAISLLREFIGGSVYTD
eukprot:ANDGO_02138.mRNA.1 Uridine kinase